MAGKEVSFHIQGEPIHDMSGKDIIDRLEKCGGDLFKFCRTFAGTGSGNRETIIQKALLILHKPENHKWLEKWQEILQCYEQAKLMVEGRRRLQHLKKMPKPTDSSKATEWIKYAEFWRDMTQVGDTKESKQGAQESEWQRKRRELAEVMIEKMKNEQEGRS